MKAAVLGATGYGGMLLLRLLNSHNKIESIAPVSTSAAGKKILNIDPGLFSTFKKKSRDTNNKYISIEKLKEFKPDIIFSALPHLASLSFYRNFIGKSIVIDLSADLRFEKMQDFEKAYGINHPEPQYLGKSIYGLSEWYKEGIKQASIIANPGCYPTCSLLPLLPLLTERIISGNISINALSGISGAGKKASINNLFVERSENCNAYSPGKKHRHYPEIKKEIAKTGCKTDIIFTPHLIPIKRGMFVSTIADLNKKTSNDEIGTIFNKYYGQSPFIKINNDRIPETANVRGSNRCDINWELSGDRIILFSTIDNLMKGASGQAIQNMNIRFGFDETEGLRMWGDI